MYLFKCKISKQHPLLKHTSKTKRQEWIQPFFSAEFEVFLQLKLKESSLMKLAWEEWLVPSRSKKLWCSGAGARHRARWIYPYDSIGTAPLLAHKTPQLVVHAGGWYFLGPPRWLPCASDSKHVSHDEPAIEFNSVVPPPWMDDSVTSPHAPIPSFSPWNMILALVPHRSLNHFTGHRKSDFSASRVVMRAGTKGW